MILHHINLTNFRVFKGSHDITLRSENPEANKPITLFGGLNGSGKTSILSAIRLILLGKRALPNPVTKNEYSKYLKKQITHDADYASVTLDLSKDNVDGQTKYRLTKSWDKSGSESLSLAVDEKLKDELTPEQIEGFLFDLVPQGVGDLFFFDGEKIAQLAEDDTGTYLRKAAHKLLGIDVIERLDKDLELQLKQFSRQSLSAPEQERLDLLEDEKEAALQNGYRAREKADSLSVALKDLERKESAIETELSAKGGAWAESREKQSREADSLFDEQHQLKGEVLSEVGSFLPLSLAVNELANLEHRLEEESEAKKKKAFLSELDNILPDIKESFSKYAEPALVNTLSKSILETANSQDSYSNISDIVVDLSDSDFARFKEHIHLAKEAQRSVHAKVNRLKTVTEKLDNLSMNLERAPQESELIELHEQLRKVTKEISLVRRNYLATLRDAKFFVNRALELSRQLEKQYASKSSESTLRKSIERAERARAALSNLKQQVLTSRVAELEKCFVDSFRRLNRKASENIGVKIDPSSFNVTLLDNSGYELDRKIISAGEKQIFALAILEALGALSGKDLPLVIDTPLGRLDSSHRTRIVNNYFPQASKQVIILSTDTEIDEDLYQQLEPVIDMSYKLQFDDETESTQVERGYFWDVMEETYAAK